MSVRYYLLHPSGRYFLHLKVKRFLKGLVCLFRGHDNEPIVDSTGRIKADAVRMRFGIRGKTVSFTPLYRCRRCGKNVPRPKK